MRQNIETVTGSNLVNMSLDNLQDELKFYKKYSEGAFGKEIQKDIIKAIEVEIAIRKNNIECPSLKSLGECSEDRVVGCFGPETICPKLSGGYCLSEQMDLLSLI